MYEDILSKIKEGKSILFLNKNKINYSSHIVHLLLSGYSPYNKVTIVDHEEEINFINLNFKTSQMVNLYEYQDISDSLDVFMKAKNETNQQIFICNPINCKIIKSLRSHFDYLINIYNKEDYKIINNKFQRLKAF